MTARTMRSAVTPGRDLSASESASRSAVGSAIGVSIGAEGATSVRRQPLVRLSALVQEKDGRTALAILGVEGGRFDGLALLAFLPLDTGDLEDFLAHFGSPAVAWRHRSIADTPIARMDATAPITDDEVLTWAAVCDRMHREDHYEPFGWAGELL